MISTIKKGELAAYGAALLWSFFPIITVIAATKLSPFFSGGIATGFSTLLFACILFWKKRWPELLESAAWRDILLATFFIGIVFYGLVFLGYHFTTPGNGAVVSLMEVLFAFLIVNVLWKHEPFIPIHALGALLMLIGTLFVLLPKWNGTWNIGDLMILLGTASAPIGNIFAQKARMRVSAETIMFVRSSISTAFLLLLAIHFEPFPSKTSLIDSLPYIILSGIFLLGLSKILWLAAIHRLPITKTVALTEIEVLLTLLFAYLFLGYPITLQQATGALPMITGIWILTKDGSKAKGGEKLV